MVPKVPLGVGIDIVPDNALGTAAAEQHRVLGTAEIAPDRALEVEVVALNSGQGYHLHAPIVGGPGIRGDSGMKNPDRSHVQIVMLPAG